MTLPDGWLEPEEAAELKALAHGKLVLELGAWKGRSTVAFAETALHVVSVDRHQGIAEVGGEDSLPDYLDAVRGLENVSVVIADFGLFVPNLGRDFHLAYVDGDHDADSAERDALLACQHVRWDVGVVAFHDWDFDSVREGVGRVFGRSPDRVVGSVASFRVQRGRCE